MSKEFKPSKEFNQRVQSIESFTRARAGGEIELNPLNEIRELSIYLFESFEGFELPLSKGFKSSNPLHACACACARG
jgi:hypothetical protein